MIERLPRIAGAYLTASLTAGFVLALSALILPPLGSALEGRGFVNVPAPLAFLQMWLLVGGWVSLFVIGLALVPAVIVIAFAEAARLRSAAFYGGAGSVGAIACWAIFIREDGGLLPMSGLAFSLAPERALATSALVLVVGLAGLLGGLVYWRMAGRSAGDWRVASGGKR